MASTQIAKPYVSDNIKNTLDSLKITQNGLNVLTHYDGRLIANSTVSDNYELFDFSNFAKNVLSEIENYFTPEEYILKITKGQQELRLIGEEVLINGEVYKKMFNIFNSTDRSRALGLNTGLLRFVCTNGMVIGLENETANVKVKHYKNRLPGKVETFLNGLDQFNLNVESQAGIIENLATKQVSFKELAKKLAVDNKNIITDGSILKLNAFAKKLQFSETDRLANLAKEQIELLNNPILFKDRGYDKVDIVMPSYQALNCYTEIWRNRDSGTLNRETNRILELI